MDREFYTFTTYCRAVYPIFPTQNVLQVADARNSNFVVDGDRPADGNVPEFMTYGVDQHIPITVVFYRRGVDE